MSAAAPFSPVSTTTTNVKTIFVRLLIQHLAIYDTSEMKRIRLVSAMEITLACGNYFSPPIKKMHVYFCWCLRSIKLECKDVVLTGLMEALFVSHIQMTSMSSGMLCLRGCLMLYIQPCRCI
ncbi:uncharacterized protein LOC131610451 isoform X1 [Vicia villosa]|uniref:uncharacterized protein LOC131610451 isoform X1 n=1 Tax=Vicia villosa TaxID=3911 RepID=UPI00273C722C|nr:uncharacterized protein LOC131610451 isoform X1 [Vicia villosa]